MLEWVCHTTPVDWGADLSHYFAPFVDLYIIHYVLIAYSTLNIVSFVYIYIFINLFVFSLLNLFIYLSIFLRAVG